MKQLRNRIFLWVLVFILILTGCEPLPPGQTSFSLDSIPEFSGEPYVVLQENQPSFEDDELTTQAFESYSPLDALGRCGVAYACVGLEIMPTEERGAIGQVKPSGWHLVKYDCVDGKYLYNRCHLIGYQLSGENANECNLITGTRYLNVTGMLPFENQVADYVEETGNHVLYRATPIFQGMELVARGVQMEAWSVEDSGAGVCFNVYVYNSQPGVVIDYATGDSWLEGEQTDTTGQPEQQPQDTPGNGPEESTDSSVQPEGENTYIININSGRFHDPDCSGAASMKPENRQEYTGTRQTLIEQGYVPCGQCKP